MSLADRTRGSAGSEAGANIAAMRARNVKFIADYFHDGLWRSVEIYAADFEDAEVICKAHNLRLAGEYIATIPVVGGSWLPNFIVRLRNWLIL